LQKLFTFLKEYVIIPLGLGLSYAYGHTPFGILSLRGIGISPALYLGLGEKI
jgi:hypothetical protein